AHFIGDPKAALAEYMQPGSLDARVQEDGGLDVLRTILPTPDDQRFRLDLVYALPQRFGSVPDGTAAFRCLHHEFRIDAGLVSFTHDLIRHQRGIEHELRDVVAHFVVR